MFLTIALTKPNKLQISFYSAFQIMEHRCMFKYEKSFGQEGNKTISVESF